MKLLTKNLFELLFFSAMTIIAVGLFIAAFVEGFTIQIIQGDSFEAFLRYVSALLALIASAFVFVRAKRIIFVLSKSDYIEKFFNK
ncbi:MAG: hypothetical protein CL944_02570 [Candidatus Diapherotrites archaeon]|uniref:Uncharacterized protein n=1 Tax=Candidatus Iainarchaeum sp. TaxID=3101447 RepID=A0A2D6LQ77_9ARCH|nr:hypothetical protein [Candidatus Diapherotrites archaeon]|tara:strand:- start:34470 stop:34727 length:258 start_codon:yes stop_codon:yes gene_type:complete